MNILFIGDIVGRAGRRAVRKFIPELREKNTIDLIIANGENAAGGFGITEKVANELFDYGIDCITMGNHTWNNKDIFNFINDNNNLIRPLNYMPEVPGKGWAIIESNDIKVAVINLIGQVFMDSYNSPVYIYNKFIDKIRENSDFTVIDFHAEATGEKLAFANYVDGQVTAVVGTHTHVQTADNKILPGGTAYITDLGMTGAVNSILGMNKKEVIKKYTTKLPGRFSVATGKCQLEGVIININIKNKKANNIKRLHISD